MISHVRASSAGLTSAARLGGRRIGPALAIALLALLLVPALAAAAPEREFLETFGPAQQPNLGKPAGMTVDPATGDLYVIDLEDKTLHRYNPDGSPDNFSALAGNVIDGHAGEADATASGEVLHTESGRAFEAEVAVAPPGAAGGTEGDIYLTSPMNGVIDVFDQSGALITEKQISSFPCGVAVDPKGNVFVGSFEGENAGITKLTPTSPGSFEESEASPYPLASACQMAAGEGFVYGSEYGGPVHKFPSQGGEEGTDQYTVTSSISGSIAIDPESGRLLVPRSEGGNRIEEYIVSGSQEAALVSTIELQSAPQGVAVNGESGELFATREGSGGVEVYGFAFHTLGIAIAGTGSGTVQCKIGTGSFGSCAGAINGGKSVTVKATAAQYSTFAGWSNGTGSVSACTGTSECTFNLETDSTLKATFDRNTHTLAVTIGGNGVGAVACKIGSGSFGFCGVPLPEGEQITVKATEAAHSVFEGFSAASGSAAGCAGAAHECSFQLLADGAFTATYARLTHSLSVSTTGAGQGEVKCKLGEGPEEACKATYNEHAEITLVAHPAANSSFAGFSGTGSASNCSSAASCTFFLEADSSATAQLNAVKQPNTPTGGGGSGSKPNPPPPPSQCLVPKLKGLSLAKAKSELSKADCAAGKVTKPKAKKAEALVVRSSKPGAGSILPAGGEVDLTLAPKPKNKRGKK